MPGPLPKPDARRRNAPTIPTTQLPVTGRTGPAPKCPYKLGKAGKAWWKWAWATPQAAAWDDGGLYALARRAQLEDELAALATAETPDWGELLGYADDREARERLEWLLSALQSKASGSTGLMREMRELDNRFGLNAKAMADLRWTIIAPAEEEEPGARSDRPRLRAV